MMMSNMRYQQSWLPAVHRTDTAVLAVMVAILLMEAGGLTPGQRTAKRAGFNVGTTRWAHSAGAPDASPDTDAEQRLLDLTNAERRQRGLPELQMDDHLREAARNHTRELVQHGELSHQFPGEPAVRDRLAQTGVSFNNDGENVAFAADAAEAHDGLMHSPPHRANILSPKFNAVGIGAIKAKDLWMTEDFVHRIDTNQGQQESSLAAAIRGASGKSALRRLRPPDLHKAVCRMAQEDRLAPGIVAAALTGANYVSAFTTWNNQLPAPLVKALREGAQAYALGVCFARSRTYPSGVYWVGVGVYR